MILTLNFINCAHFNTDESIIRSYYGNEDIKYISIISNKEKKYKPYFELEKDVEDINQPLWYEIVKEVPQEISTCEYISVSLPYLSIDIEKYILECRKKIEEYENKMKTWSSQLNETDINIEKPDEYVLNRYKNNTEETIKIIYDLRNEQLPQITVEIGALNGPIEIKNLLLEFINLIYSFLLIYNMEKEILIPHSSNEYRIKICNYNIEIFSLFKHIPLIETLEIMKKKLELYEYTNINIWWEIIKIFDSLKAKLDILLIKSDEVVRLLKLRSDFLQ
ncbi:uncharacterized protein VNE69_01200 [Vairimorpha necatrix]|uniref:Uncharacterized protein n=1 Tax=Vairimorpha necatrix TaxID=6039 RepID=A0AAX4J8K1_9MICR